MNFNFLIHFSSSFYISTYYYHFWLIDCFIIIICKQSRPMDKYYLYLSFLNRKWSTVKIYQLKLFFSIIFVTTTKNQSVSNIIFLNGFFFFERAFCHKMSGISHHKNALIYEGYKAERDQLLYQNRWSDLASASDGIKDGLFFQYKL